MKWADFGLSKPVNERGSYSMSGIRGTIDWLAPEILRLYYNQTLPPPRGTIQSDVFTEGLVFGYILLDGVHLFGSGPKIQTNVLKNKPVNLDSKFIQIQINYKTR
jgi:serine/threonine protein kinase